MFYYFNDIIKLEDIDSDNILIDEKAFENILIYDVSYKTLIGAKLLRIRFDLIDGFIITYDVTRYLVLFGPGKYDAIYNRIRYLISLKSSITYVFCHNYAKIKVDYYNFLPIEKILHNVIILVKFLIKIKVFYHYNIFVEKCL